MLRLTALVPAVVGMPLGERVESELARRASLFTREELRVGRGRRTALQEAAVRAYAGWLSARMLVTSEEVQRRVIETLGRDGAPAELDPSAAALAWHRAVVARTDLTPVEERLAGRKEPCRIARREAYLEPVGDCALLRPVYGAIFRSEPALGALVEDLVRAPRPELLAPILAGRADLRILLEALAKRPDALRVVLRQLAVESVNVGPRDETLGALRAAWTSTPALRPSLLLAVTALEAGRGRGVMSELAKSVDAELFTAFLAESPQAVELAPRLWPALPHVDAKVELAAPSLDRWLRTPGLSPSRRKDVVGDFVDVVCTSRDREGSRVLRVLLRKHEAASPSGSSGDAERLERCAR